MYARGEVVEVSDEHADILLRNGAADPADAVVDSESGVDVDPEEPPAPPVDEEAEDSDEEPVVEVKKPRKTDKVDVWRAYAAAVNYPHKGKTREQLIAELA